MTRKLHHRPPLTASLVALLAVFAACSDSSPTRPERPGVPGPQPSRVVFADPEAFPEERELMLRLIEETLDAAEEALDTYGVLVTVYDAPARAIPGWGMGGYAPSGSEIEIVFDSGFSGLAAVLPERLPQVVAHEMHHVGRWRGPGYGGTLLEAMVSEGLADHFAIELLGVPVPPWSDAFPEDRTDFYLARAAPELDSAAYDFNAWFFGLGTDLPRWTGYTLGFRLVRDYLDRHPDASAAGLVHASAELFRPEV